MFILLGFPPIAELFTPIDMPMFFLLSGFSLSVAYGKTMWNGATRCSLGCKKEILDNDGNLEDQKEKPNLFDSWGFYKKRLIRILPLHYLGNVAILTSSTFK